MGAYGSGQGEVLAQASIDGTTDAVFAANNIASIATTTTKRKYRVTLGAVAGGGADAVQPLGYTNATAAAGRMLRISFVSNGVYDVEVVDSTGAAADATGVIILTFLRGPKLG